MNNEYYEYLDALRESGVVNMFGVEATTRLLFLKMDNMNEITKQLAEQATTYIDPSANDGVCWDFDKEKFAQLIVQECINIVKPTQHHEAFAQDYLGDVEGLELLEGRVKQIKEHFGVDL